MVHPTWSLPKPVISVSLLWKNEGNMPSRVSSLCWVTSSAVHPRGITFLRAWTVSSCAHRGKSSWMLFYSFSFMLFLPLRHRLPSVPVSADSVRNAWVLLTLELFTKPLYVTSSENPHISLTDFFLCPFRHVGLPVVLIATVGYFWQVWADKTCFQSQYAHRWLVFLSTLEKHLVMKGRAWWQNYHLSTNGLSYKKDRRWIPGFLPHNFDLLT